MRKTGSLLLVLIFSLIAILGCSHGDSENLAEGFPYQDLSEEQYVENAYTAMKDIINYLENAPSGELEDLLETYHNEQAKDEDPENFTAGQMLTELGLYCMEKKGESLESLDAMTEEELEAFQRSCREETEKTIPNAVKVNEQSTGPNGEIGRIVFRDGSEIVFTMNGSFG